MCNIKMGKSKKCRCDDSSSSCDSDSSFEKLCRKDPLKLHIKRLKLERKMIKKNRCVCGYCPPGNLACSENFIKKYRGSH
ncbi:unnamed protein product [Dicrocoelium dendriticum]|nr:unnamed protein product [Dicrocoelium dendriticum]